MNTKILEQIGLSKNEIKVYFALLELGQTTATPIVKTSKIPNSKVYPILQKLIEKGLVSYVIKNKIKHFQSVNAHRLIDLLKQKEEEIREQKSEIEKLIPEIEEKRTSKEEIQQAEIYEGLKGVTNALLTQLQKMKKGEEYKVFSIGEQLLDKKVKLFFDSYHTKRIERGIKAKLIISRLLKESFKKNYNYKNMKTRYTSIKLPSGVFIFKDTVVTFVWGEKPIAFVIESKQNADRYCEFFDEIWDISKD